MSTRSMLEPWSTRNEVDDDWPWPYRYLGSFGTTISGGTSEIQRNIIAERVLGLPR